MKLDSKPPEGWISPTCYHYFAIQEMEKQVMIGGSSPKDKGKINGYGQTLDAEQLKIMAIRLYEWYLYLSQEEF